MLQYSEIKIGDWYLYTPDKKYCTVKSVGENILMDGAIESFSCRIWDLAPINITNEFPTLFGFKPDGVGFSKISASGEKYFIFFNRQNRAELWVDGVLIQNIPYVHNLQNYFLDELGEKLEGNLYGSPSYDL
jgi:hypothetical protein